MSFELCREVLVCRFSDHKFRHGNVIEEHRGIIMTLRSSNNVQNVEHNVFLNCINT